LSKWNKKKSDEANPVELVQERVKAFSDNKIILEGTPTKDGECAVEHLGRQANQR
jgi:phage terminase large subunit GpA-like protein